MKNSTKEWIYILLLAAITVIHFFVDGLSENSKAVITIAIFLIAAVLKFGVKTKEKRKIVHKNQKLYQL
ncbi:MULTISPECIES: hypothetical protein [unclassified Exiguobacterium]|uniref:hypothetical protein n=1 Tax=unclassified Exiguobacterium TaxID=2644629 RepID=UPI001BECBD39|nr:MULTISPECIES: hypothetical protein [unclassified Exiguobacterium]